MFTIGVTKIEINFGSKSGTKRLSHALCCCSYLYALVKLPLCSVKCSESVQTA